MPRWIWVVVITFTIAAIVAAHDQVQRAPDGNDTPKILASRVVGAYRLRVGIIPGHLEVRHGHLAISVLTAARLPGSSGAVSWRIGSGSRGPLRERPVVNAEVTVSATGPEGRGYGPVRATNSSVDQQYYDAPLGLSVPGFWRLSIFVHGAKGQAQLRVPVRVHPKATPWSVLLDWGFWLCMPWVALVFSVREASPSVDVH
ncbi:MAG: hypothetical protein ACYCOU_18895 [Sulfobacillus sp.]